jgi:hypothetical protein
VGVRAALLVASFAVVPSASRADDATGRQQPLLGVLRLANKLALEDRRLVDALYVEDALRSEALRTLPDFRVVDRADLSQLAAAQGRDLGECEGSCAVETARNLGLDYVVTGDLTRFGATFKAVLRLNRASDGAQLSGSQASGATVDELDRNLAPAVRELLAPLAPRIAAPLRAGMLDAVSARQGPALLPIALLAGGVVDARNSTAGAELLLALPAGPLDLRLGLHVAPHLGFRAAALFNVGERAHLGLAAGVRLLVVPGLTAGAAWGGGAGLEGSAQLWRELAAVAGLWLEAYRNGDATLMTPLVTLGLRVRL